MKTSMTISLFMCCFIFLILDSPSLATKLDNISARTILLDFTKLSPTHPSKALKSASLGRPRYLKQKSTSFSSKIPIIPHKYGALIPLSFGTPQQTLHFVIDTASSLTWFPCNLTSKKDREKDQIFYPRLSSSSKYIGCNHPKSLKFHAGQAQYQCINCKYNNSQNCLAPLGYNISYVLGHSSGVYLSETLKIPKHTVKDFIVGCSDNNLNGYGIVGFGREIDSFPSQLGIQKFSFCLPRNQLNESRRSNLFLNGGSYFSDITYTPFHKPSSSSDVSDSYYVILEEIIVGNKSIIIPKKFLAPKANGYGGTIVDIGSTHMHMYESIFRSIAREFQKQLGKGRIHGDKQLKAFCFEFSSKEISTLPNLALRFKGGATMKLPWHNYLTISNGLGCLSIFPRASSRTAVVLGNSQLRDFYMEFDLEKERLGFLANKCN